MRVGIFSFVFVLFVVFIVLFWVLGCFVHCFHLNSLESSLLGEVFVLPHVQFLAILFRMCLGYYLISVSIVFSYEYSFLGPLF